MRGGNFWALYYPYVKSFKTNDDKTRHRLQRKWFAREMNAKKSRPKQLPEWTQGLRRKVISGWYWYDYIADKRKYHPYFGVI